MILGIAAIEFVRCIVESGEKNMRSFLSLSAGAGIAVLSSSVLFGDVSTASSNGAVYSESAPNIEAVEDGIKNSLQPTTLNTEQFVKAMALRGLSDQAISRLALERSRNLRVSLLANGVIKDSEEIATALKAVANPQKVAIPDKLDVEHQAALSSLKLQQLEKFDTAYVLQMRQDHDKALALLEQAKNNSAIDSKLREFADKSLVIVRERDGQLQAMNLPVKAARMVTAAQ